MNIKKEFFLAQNPIGEIVQPLHPAQRVYRAHGQLSLVQFMKIDYENLYLELQVKKLKSLVELVQLDFSRIKRECFSLVLTSINLTKWCVSTRTTGKSSLRGFLCHSC